MPFNVRKTLILSKSDVHSIIRKYGLDSLMDTVIERLTVEMADYDPNETSIPVRSGFQYENPQSGLIEWMPLYKQGGDVLIKIVGYHPANPDRFGLPTIVSTLSAYDTSTGHLAMVMDGMFSTALRTGAATAVASQLMAPGDSSILGLIGCGAQAVTQLHALSRVFELETVLIYDSDHEAINSMPKRCEILNLGLKIVPSEIETIVATSDILCTATSIDVGAGPLFSGLATKPDVHINAVGSDLPGKIELPPDILKRSFVSPDFREQAILEGECQQLEAAEIGADLFEVVRNPDAFPGLQERITVFDSTGWVLEDQVVTDLFLEYALEMKLGQKIEIEAVPEDARNPYHFAANDELNAGFQSETSVEVLSKKIH